MPVPATPITVTSNILSELIASLRNTTRDIDRGVPTDLLWSDSEWIEYLNEGENEICWRARVLEDSTNSTVCNIALLTGSSILNLHTSVIDVENIRFSADTSLVLNSREHKVTEKWLDDNYSNWRNLTAGNPMYYIVKPNDKIILVPAVSSTFNSTTMYMTVRRLSLAPISVTNPAPEIPSRYHSALKLWALYRAYSKKDSQTFDENAASNNYKLFTSMVGERPAFNVERVEKEEPSGLSIGIRR